MRTILTLLFFCSFLFAEHWEVSVHLKNKSVLHGYVLEDRFIEVFAEDIWLPSALKKKAGIRLWFVADSQGFIYLEYRNITKVERVRSVSQKEIETLQTSFVEAEEEKPKPIPKEEPKVPEKEKKVKPSTEEDPLPLISEAQLEYYQEILEKYPPRLWNLSYVRNKMRIQAMNAIPFSKRYRDFLAVYEDWKEAQEVFLTGAPIQYSEEECEEILKQYGNLIEQFPPKTWDLVTVGKRARSKSVQGTIIPQKDLEFFANYDNWRKAVKAVIFLEDGSAQKESKRRLKLQEDLEKQQSVAPPNNKSNQ